MNFSSSNCQLWKFSAVIFYPILFPFLRDLFLFCNFYSSIHNNTESIIKRKERNGTDKRTHIYKSFLSTIFFLRTAIYINFCDTIKSSFGRYWASISYSYVNKYFRWNLFVDMSWWWMSIDDVIMATITDNFQRKWNFGRMRKCGLLI